MATAFVMAARSTCIKGGVGAVACSGNRVLVQAYAGSVSGDVHCLDVGCAVDEGGPCRGMHAPLNLLVQAALHGVILTNCKIYVTKAPCFQCVKALAGIHPSGIHYADGTLDMACAKLAQKTGFLISGMKRGDNGWILRRD